MKIGLFIISKGFAGMERSFGYLIKNLEKYGIEVVVFTNSEMIKYYSDIKGKIYDLGQYNTNNKVMNRISFIKIAMKLKDILKSEKIELLHLHSDSATTSYYYIKKNFKIPYIIAFRGTDIETYQYSNSIVYKNITYPIINKMIEKSKAITFVSKWQIGEKLHKYKDKTYIIPNGVDTKTFKKGLEKQEDNIILFAGRFVELKGIKEIISVANELPEYEFWFVGDGPLKDILKGNNIINLGYKQTNELIKLYNKATICLLPSHHEGFSNAGLEIISCSRCLICTPKGFSEYIENKKDGIIIPSKNKNALKDAVIDLMLDKDKREKIEKKARKKALKYNLDTVAKKYIDVYSKILK